MMSEAVAEPTPNPGAVSKLAVASLILGLLAVSLPAVICGHLAKSKLKRGEGQKRDESVSTAGLAIGYVGMVLQFLMLLFLPMFGNSNFDLVLENRALQTARNLKMAVVVYESEYRRNGVGDEITARSDQAVMNVLLAADSEREEGGGNPRAIVFYSDRQAKGSAEGGWKQGLVLNDDGGGALYDPWGSLYYLAFDLDGDGRITIATEEKADPIIEVRDRVLVWSAGPDGIAGNEDDLRSW